VRLARRPIAAARGALLLLGACGRGSTVGTTAPTSGDQRAVAVLARHVRHQGELAGAAARRLATIDSAAATIAGRIAEEATARADALDGVLRGWGVDAQAEAALFAGAVGLGTVAPGTIVYGCSLAAPLDDVTQIQQVDADRAAGRYGQLAMAGAVEARALAATDADGRTAQSRSQGAEIDAWERDLLRAVAPWVPVTDRAYAARGGETP
jgi:hypothetical protein